MRRLLANQSRTGLIVTEFGPGSIMLCSLPVEAFRQGQASSCYISRKNNIVSPADVSTVRKPIQRASEARHKHGF